MIVSAADAITWMGLTATAALMAQFEIMAKAADAVIKGQIGLDIEQTSYPGAADNGDGDSGYYFGDASRYLFLRQTPATTITSVYEDSDAYAGTGTDPFPSSTLLVSGTDYYLHLDGCLPGITTKCSYSGILERIGANWPGIAVREGGNLTRGDGLGRGNIKIAYTAGWPTVPSDIVAACCQLISWMRGSAERGGLLESERLGNYQYTLAKATEGASQIGSVQSILGRYKRRRVA